MTYFDPTSKEHKAIVIAAIVNADIFGAGRISMARDRLEFNNIFIEDTRTFESCVFEWGGEI